MASEWEELEKLSKDELIIEADKIVGSTRAPKPFADCAENTSIV